MARPLMDAVMIRVSDRSRLAWLDGSRIAVIVMLAAVFASVMFTPPAMNEAGAPLTGAHNGLQLFEAFGLCVAAWRAIRLRSPSLRADALAAICVIAAAFLGWEVIAVFAASAFLYFRNRSSIDDRAAAAVTAAVGMQALIAPFIFMKLSGYLLPLDAAAAGGLLKVFVPLSSFHGTFIWGPSGHSVNVLAGCSSFHNLSLASLCWVTITMMQRPYWTWRDPLIFATAAALQIVCNVARLTLVSANLAMYHFWHQGLGTHIFAAAATSSAIVISYYGARWAAAGTPIRAKTAQDANLPRSFQPSQSAAQRLP